MSLVSVIIPVYNRGKLVMEAIHSVVSQTYRPIEIILVDDGSIDDTPEVLEHLRRTTSVPVTVIRQNNAGPGAAREAGRQIARGEYIQYLDSDDRLLPEKFSAQVAALEANPDCGIAYGKTRLVDEGGTILRAPYKKTGEKKDFLFPDLLADRWWNTHTPLYRRSVCDKVGAWPINRISEDWQYDARCGGLSTRLVYCDLYASDTIQHSGERLTRGPLSPQKLRDTGDLLLVLYQCAIDAGVPFDSPQMRHFSRWALSLARQLGAISELERARTCLNLAQKSARGFRTTMEVIGVKAIASLVGWSNLQSLVQLVLKLRGRSHSQETLPPSWL